jgi:hypothetical protein
MPLLYQHLLGLILQTNGCAWRRVGELRERTSTPIWLLDLHTCCERAPSYAGIEAYSHSPPFTHTRSFHCDPFFVYDGRHHGDVPVAYFGSRPWSSVSFKEIQGLRSVGSRNQTQVEEHLAPIRRAIRRSGIPYATRAHSLPPSSRLPLVPSRADPHWP